MKKLYKRYLNRYVVT